MHLVTAFIEKILPSSDNDSEATVSSDEHLSVLDSSSRTENILTSSFTASTNFLTFSSLQPSHNFAQAEDLLEKDELKLSELNESSFAEHTGQYE